MTAFPRVLMATSEMTPYAHTGGLGDVLAALPAALVDAGAAVHVVLPAYRSIDLDAAGAEPSGTVEVWVGGHRRDVALRTVHAARAPHAAGPPHASGVTVTFVEADDYFGREHIYGGPYGDYPDNAERFAFLARAVLALAARLEPAPDVIHCHDWPTALVPVYARAFPDPRLSATRFVLTIHNLGYQGIFPASVWPLLDLDWSYFTPRTLEFYGQVNLLKGGLVFADRLTTVSPTYAKEILTPEYGNGLDGVLRERQDALSGILNGVDYTSWSPAHDPYIAAPYDLDDLAGKTRCKADLQMRFGLRIAPDTPLFGMVSRLADQKGLDILTAAIPELLQWDVQVAILGNGDARYEHELWSEGQRAPERLATRIAFDTAASHQVEAGADAYLMPSRYEPCGLNQMYSLRYGTVPVVRATGGLDDTVADHDPTTGVGTGFKFAPHTREALLDAVRRAIDAYRKPNEWRRLMRNGMRSDFSWRGPAERYLALYRSLLPPG